VSPDHEDALMAIDIEQGYRVKVSRWRFAFVRWRGMQWVCDCGDQRMFGGHGYECRHIRQVVAWLKASHMRTG
jgi:hypothetical protein